MMIVVGSLLISGIKDHILLIEIKIKWKIMTWKINNLKKYHKDKDRIVMTSNPEDNKMKPGRNHIRIEKGKINLTILIKKIKDREAIAIQN